MTEGQYGIRMFHTMPGSNTKHSCLETPGRSDFFVIFRAPVGSHVVFVCSRVLGEGAGPDSGCPGDPPGRNFKTIFNDSLRRFAS